MWSPRSGPASVRHAAPLDLIQSTGDTSQIGQGALAFGIFSATPIASFIKDTAHSQGPATAPQTPSARGLSGRTTHAVIAAGCLKPKDRRALPRAASSARSAPLCATQKSRHPHFGVLRIQDELRVRCLRRAFRQAATTKATGSLEISGSFRCVCRRFHRTAECSGLEIADPDRPGSWNCRSGQVPSHSNRLTPCAAIMAPKLSRVCPAGRHLRPPSYLQLAAFQAAAYDFSHGQRGEVSSTPTSLSGPRRRIPRSWLPPADFSRLSRDLPDRAPVRSIFAFQKSVPRAGSRKRWQSWPCQKQP